MKLTYFKNLGFLPAIKALLKELNIPFNAIADEPVPIRDILKDTYKNNPTFKLIQQLYFVGIVDDDAFDQNESLPHEKITSDYDGILFFGITLEQRENNRLPTRGQLAEIARAFNREFYYTPVVVIFKYKDNQKEYIAFANTERLPYKQEWREGEKAGKVSLLRDIVIDAPHRGHEDIINQLKISRSGTKAISDFDGLYKYWQEIFSVSILNKKFYEDLSKWYFWAIKHVTFPNEPTSTIAHKKGKDKDNLIQEHKATGVIRLLTRLLFAWFIKEKKLIPEELFDLNVLQQDILKEISPYQGEGFFKNVNKESVYYKAILQNLFFATLNCPIEPDDGDDRKRGFRGLESYGKHRGVDYLMRYEKYFKNPEAFLELMNNTVPFLNGGLFECLDEKMDKNLYIDGFSDQMTKGEKLIVPDFLFFGVNTEVDLSQDYGLKNKKYKKAAVRGLINILKSYKFTVTENTPIEEDVALDPELLGKVFENLLASYNPETKSTARKQTGSFYTPREIVNYMVDESLIAYLKTAITDWDMKEKELDEKLHQLTSFDAINPFTTDEEISVIINALDQCKILDPACGSGAFPMGILQKMVHILKKLDPDNEKWKELQLNKAIKATEEVFSIEDRKEREAKLIEINDAFDETINDPDYARKLYLIEHCIYGIDIQPIATQISKLRFFISLVVDQKVNDDKPNFGIRALPNLETKFVTANTLIGIDKNNSLFYTEAIEVLQKELKKVRHKVFSAKTKATKKKYREEDKRLRKVIADKLEAVGMPGNTAEKLAIWDPYDQNTSSSFFDAEWMFDVSKGFDVVIGNPPYIQLQSIKQKSLIFKSLNYTSYSKSGDIYCLFYEKGISLLKNNGILTYITSNKWMRAGYGKKMREYFLKETNIYQLIDFGDSPIFENATTYTNIYIGCKLKNEDYNRTRVWDLSFNAKNNISLEEILRLNNNFTYEFTSNSYLIIDSNDLKIKKQVEKIGTPIKKWNVIINRGLITGFNEAFIISNDIKEKIVLEDSNSINLLKPILRGKDIKKYKAEFNDFWMILASYDSNKLIKTKYPSIYAHLKKYETQLKARGQCTNRGGKGQHHWLELDNNPTLEYLNRFEQPKIIWAEIVYDSAFFYDESGTYQEATGFLMIGENLKYLLALLNSKPVTYFFRKFYAGGDLRGNTFRYKKAFIEKLPIPKIEKIKQKPFEILASLLLITAKKEKQSTKIIESVLDSIVIELYFSEHLKDKKINVIEYVEKDLNKVLKGKDFEQLSDTKKEQVINQLQNIWTHPDNEVRNRIKLFAVRSPEILKPILES